MVLHNISYNNNRYYLCCSLGNSTFFIGTTAVALNGHQLLNFNWNFIGFLDLLLVP
jgi:hypothetical protein